MKNLEDVYPLSPLQQGMLFHSLLAPESGIYVNQSSCRLRGELDAEKLRRSWQLVVDRHPILRSAFLWEGFDEPLQAVRSRVAIPWRTEDWRGLAATDQAARLEELRNAERRQPFHLAQAPLLRLVLIRSSDDVWELVWTFHHVLLDGWSVSLLLGELAALYSAGDPAQLPPVQPYRDYISWLERQDRSQAEAFWRHYLAGLTAPTPLGIDHPAQASATATDLAENQILVPAELTAGLQAFAARRNLTLNTVSLGAWALLLARYSGEEDIVFGGVVSGRPADLPGVESILGLFINTLPVRVRVPPVKPLTAWLQALQARQLELRQFEFSPLAQVQKWSDLPAATALFESLFVFENYPLAESAEVVRSGFSVEQVHNAESTNYPLTLAAGVAGPLFLRATWDRSRFDEDAIERLLGHLDSLLTAMAATPESPLRELPLLREAERGELVLLGHANAAQFPTHPPVHVRFEQAAARSPEAEALVAGERRLTYADLDRGANQLARRLRLLGVGPESRVALCLERSVELVTAILAVLKAGGAYVPLDPDYPRDRLDFLLEDSAARVLVTEERLKERLPAAADGLQALCLDTARNEIGHESAEPLEPSADGSYAAYVIYTSGSTGRPKGVVVPHSAVTRLLTATEPWFGFGKEDVWTLFHSCAFDFSVWEIWGALAYGGRLVIVPWWVSRSPAAFRRLLVDERVTVLNQTPSAFRQLLEVEEESGADEWRDLSLRCVIFGGEALDLPGLAPWFRRHGDELPRLVNMYGITETTVHVTYRPVGSADVAAAAGSVIGGPIPDLRLHVLDGALEPTPMLVPGEICVGGAGLARGYLGRPELTAERFVPDPFSPEPGARLYRSGDLARRLPAGDLQYLGRIDHQVKIRGFRIEPGEIEAALREHPGVRASAVLARDGEGGHRQLVAYVVGGPAGPPSPTELRTFLADRLPEHMVPALYVPVDEIPLTAHGKLNRRSLPEPAADRSRLDAPFVPPESPAEKALAEIWSEVLGTDRVGREDSFFALGGDSILSLRVLSQARERGLGLTLQQIFQRPRLRELAQVQSGGASTEERVPPFALISEEERARLPEDAEDAYPLAMLQAGMVFHTERSPQTAAYHDIFSYHLRAPFDGAALAAAVERLLERHPILRTSFALTGFREPLQLVHRSVPTPLAVDDLRGFAPEKREAALQGWIEAEKGRPFVWSRPPLLRVQVHRLTEDELQLSLSFHHSILDGWSLATFLAELFREYLALLGRTLEPAPAPPLLAYREFVAAERRAITSRESADFWAANLAGSNATLIPRWPGYPRGLSRQIRLPTQWLDRSLTDDLRALAEAAGAPLKSVLLAAYLRVVSLWSGERDVTTGLISHGRPEGRDGERVLGLFLNAVPFRLELPGGTWIELIRQALRTETKLLPHRQVPLAELQRRMGGQALFETSFTYVNFHVLEKIADLPDLQVLGGAAHEETNFALSVNYSFTAATGRVGVGFDYDASLLDPEQAQWIAGSCLAALRTMASAPNSRYEETPLLPAAERERLVSLGAGPEALAPRASAHRLFEERARKTPDALAVIASGASLTYGELDRRANQVARALKMWGVRTDARVALFVDRSTDLAVGLLAIWKAGGAYLPLDPSYPAERLRFMVEDAGADLLVTTDALLDQLPPGLDRPSLVRLDADAWLFDTQSADELAEGDAPESLAYVIYTSGSTGLPKGVMVPHGGLGNLAAAQARLLDVRPGDRILQLASLSFDASVWEVVMALLNGAELHLADPGQLLPGPQLTALLGERRITHLTIPPSALAVVAPAELPDLRTLVVAGEACAPELARRWGRGRRFVDAYGPTEATVCATATEVDGDGERLPIGRPIPGVRALVLDAHFQPACTGVPGELVLGGTGLARGYAGRPDLTAERFVPDPFPSGAGGCRLYRTGDLARWRPDGNLDFLGRLDHQVKIRGYRIEIGEVEARLASHPAVQDAIVLAREDQPGDRRIVAYVVPARESDPRDGEQPAAVEPDPAFLTSLREHLRETLPEHMIPAAFVLLPALPVTPSGKVDRAALPAPEQLRPALERPFAAPRNPVEVAVAQIWTEALSLDRVGVDDNFFEIGGHSLLATQIALRLTESFGIDVPVQALFDAPTVASLSTLVVQKRAEQTDADTVAKLLSELEQLSEADLEQRLALPVEQPVPQEPVHE